MATTATVVQGTSTALTMTLASLASSTTDVGRQSAAVDNTTTDALDYIVGGKVTTGTSPTVNKLIEIWMCGSYDGTSYAGGAGASDAALTPTGTKSLLIPLLAIPVTATSNVTYTWCIPSLAAACGGTLPLKFAIYITQNTGVALHATAGNHEVKYTAINTQAA
jgi:hypothetical protein